MDQNKGTELLEKYHAGTCTEAEKNAVEAWYNFHGQSAGPEAVDEDLELRKELIWNRVNSNKVKAVKLRVWKYAGVAAAVAVMVFGIWFFSATHHPDTPSPRTAGSVLMNDIAPGKNKATVTFANGRIISLSDAKTGIVINAASLKYDDGTDISSSSRTTARDLPSLHAAEMTSVATPRGGTYQVVLPDGSKVWLNADSKISFANQFTGNTRKIVLSGEAYFEVAKDRKHPFVVQTDRQDVTVLGTHFNISAYKDEVGIKTTLLEGSVRVRTISASVIKRKGLNDDNLNTKILKPGEQSVLIDGHIQVQKADLEIDMAWKNGLFAYRDTPLKRVMQQLSRWYNIEVEYENDNLKERKLSGSVSRYDHVSGLLKVIENTGAAQFKISGRKIIVTE